MGSGKDWSDLRPRVISAIVLIAIAVLAISMGGIVLAITLAVLIGLIVWELASMIGTSHPYGAIVLGLAAASVSLLTVWMPFPWYLLIFLGYAAIGAILVSRMRFAFALVSFASLIAAYGIADIRKSSVVIVAWFVCVIISSDVMGYFAGKTFGGPKFWPKISPKKTWSGTVAGWLSAAVVGAIFAMVYPEEFAAYFTSNPWAIALLSAVIAFFGQMGDIVESAIKRKVGVKDSSNLIPGHGGFMDRFDAMTGGAVALGVLSTFL